jgi:hypothetical protein
LTRFWLNYRPTLGRKLVPCELSDCGRMKYADRGKTCVASTTHEDRSSTKLMHRLCLIVHIVTKILSLLEEQLFPEARPEKHFIIHTSNETPQFVSDHQMVAMPNGLHSPDLAPRDLYFFSPRRDRRDWTLVWMRIDIANCGSDCDQSIEVSFGSLDWPAGQLAEGHGVDMNS